MAGERELLVELQPVGRRVRVKPATTVLAAARACGVELVSLCGGAGLCGACRVASAGHGLGPPTGQELALLGPDERSAGVRLACQATVVADVQVGVPPGSLSTPQRLQLEGFLQDVAVADPCVAAVELRVLAPTVSDLRSDATRLEDALAAAGEPAARPGLAVLARAPITLRAEDWEVRAALRRTTLADSTGESQTEVVALLAPDTKLLGAAIDVGTTKLAAYLMDLESGATLAKGAAPNPQLALGEDVMSRISRAMAGGARELQLRVADGVNRLLGQLRDEVGASPEQLVEAVAVGNTAMHHLLAGLPVRQLGTAPYVPAVTEALELPAGAAGLELAQGAVVYLPPNIAGFVGADHTAVLLASGVAEGGRPVLVLDIGTNTEISVACNSGLWTCSAASGPAFEGARIHDGMRAAEGAVERVRHLDGRFTLHTIGGGAPAGICGSGILDAVVAGRAAGIIEDRGGFRRSHALVTRARDGPAWILVPAAQTAHGRDIVVTRRDVGEIQLAKSAIRSGIEILLSAAGVRAEELEEVVVAGAFGTYLDVTSAIAIGMLPRLPESRFRQVGNAAGQGAQLLLVSRGSRRRADDISRRVHYVELTTHPGFADTFAEHLMFAEAAPAPAAAKG